MQESADGEAALLIQKNIMAKKVPIRKVAVKIGRPGYKVTKVRDPATRQMGLLFQIHYPEIGVTIKPRHRFMSSFEQKIETPSKLHQYLLIAAEPYETIGFKIQARDIERSEERFIVHWDADTKTFSLQFFFKNDSSSLVV